jgi:hypothetical protein
MACGAKVVGKRASRDGAEDRWNDHTVGVIFDYFSAASDELAASAIDIPVGPGGPLPPLPMPVAEIVRLRGREGLRELQRELSMPRLHRAETGFWAVSAKGFNPVTDLGTIEEILTGIDFGTLLDRPRNGDVIAERNNNCKLVVTISDELQALLADTGAAELAAAAGQWAKVNGSDSGDAAVIAHLLSELSALARGANVRKERLYCWICVLSPCALGMVLVYSSAHIGPASRETAGQAYAHGTNARRSSA